MTFELRLLAVELRTFNFQFSTFNSKISPVGTTDHRQAVERIARNPCEKDVFIIIKAP